MYMQLATVQCSMLHTLLANLLFFFAIFRGKKIRCRLLFSQIFSYPDSSFALLKDLYRDTFVTSLVRTVT